MRAIFGERPKEEANAGRALWLRRLLMTHLSFEEANYKRDSMAYQSIWPIADRGSSVSGLFGACINYGGNDLYLWLGRWIC